VIRPRPAFVIEVFFKKIRRVVIMIIKFYIILKTIRTMNKSSNSFFTDSFYSLIFIKGIK